MTLRLADVAPDVTISRVARVRDLHIGPEIGKGGFGAVHEGWLGGPRGAAEAPEGALRVAVKELNVSAAHEAEMQTRFREFAREATIMW